jgi:hypothetical protein
MALIDKITGIDTEGMSQDNIDLLLEGIAHNFGLHKDDGSIDISDPDKVFDEWKKKQVQILAAYSRVAQKYKDDMSPVVIDISKI